jgi:hypothetical protein
MKTIAALLVLLLGLSAAGGALAIDKAYLTLLNSDMEKMKRTIIVANLKLDPSQGDRFWPLYEDYQETLGRLNQSRREVFQEYKAVAASMSDEIAGAMLTQFLDLERKEIDVKKKFYKDVEEKVSPLVAARLFQVDNQINLMLNLELAASKFPIAR